MPDVNSPDVEFSYLFRFRDLIAETIVEHRKILENQHCVWWGWWKRPAEDARLAVWDALQREIDAKGSTYAGLFDSGRENTVWCAQIGQIVPPAETGPSASPLLLPETQRHLVPDYYRNSPFSRAWLRLDAISRQPIAFFGDFSLHEAPPLPQYTPEVLRRFQNKIITDAAELRGMDTTIWHVRRKSKNDSPERLILATSQLGEPISIVPVQLRGNTLLHITDPHFAVGPNREQHVWRLPSESGTHATLADALSMAITRDKLDVGAIIVTGDLTMVGDVREFEEAGKSLAQLMGPLNLSTDHFVVIPGNHDIQWSRGDTYDKAAKVTETPDVAKANYVQFYENFLRHPPNAHLSMGRRLVLPNGFVVDLCGLNSNALATGKDFLAGMGRTDEHALASVATTLGWNSKDGFSLRILALHHHLALTEDLEQTQEYSKGFGLAIDAVRIQRDAAKFGVHLALHGHKHRAFIWRSNVYELPESSEDDHSLGRLSILGGGSAGSVENTANSSYFSALTFERAAMLLTIYRARDVGVFRPFQAWRAPLDLSRKTGGLQMCDWEAVDLTHLHAS